MYSTDELKKRIGIRYANWIDGFVKEICDEYAEDFGRLPGEDAGFFMIRYFEEALCEYTKETEPDVDEIDAFDPTDFSTICRLGGLRHLPAVHSGRECPDGNVRDVGGKEHGKSGAVVTRR